jgi:hypothetical protein
MEQINTISFKGKQEIIDIFPSECLTRLNKRKQYIKILEDNGFNWKDAQKISKIWYNIIYNKTKYIIEVYNLVMKYNKILDKNVII